MAIEIFKGKVESELGGDDRPDMSFVDASPESVELKALIGILKIRDCLYLTGITNRTEVAKIQSKEVYMITGVSFHALTED